LRTYTFAHNWGALTVVEWGPVFAQLAAHLPDWAQSAVSLIERQRLAALARDLGKLAFWNDGMLQPLKRIADSNSRAGDIQEIAWKLNRTEEEVSAATDRLRQARDSILATSLGMRLMHQIDNVVDQKMGHDALRPRLKNLVASGDCSPEEAASLIREIEAFNAELDRVHRLILSPRDQ
jgi:hypothetical protein